MGWWTGGINLKLWYKKDFGYLSENQTNVCLADETDIPVKLYLIILYALDCLVLI